MLDTPAERRLARFRPDRPTPSGLAVEPHIVVGVVQPTGNFKLDRWIVALGPEFAGCAVTVFILDHHDHKTVIIFHRHARIHEFTLDPTRRRQTGRRAALRQRPTLDKS